MNWSQPGIWVEFTYNEDLVKRFEAEVRECLSQHAR